TAVSYEDDVHPYSDLVLGRVDAVLLDNILADRRKKVIIGFTIQPATVTSSHYVGVLSPPNASLRDRANEILKQAMRDGTLEKIFRKWQVWNDEQPLLYKAVLAGETIPAVTGIDTGESAATQPWWGATLRYLPALLRASVVTILLSCVSMALAVT